MSGRKPTTQTAILAAVKEHGPIGSGDVSKLLGAERANISSLMARMVKDGVLVASKERWRKKYSMGVARVPKPMLQPITPTPFNPDCGTPRSRAQKVAPGPAVITSRTKVTIAAPMPVPTRTNTHSMWG